MAIKSRAKYTSKGGLGGRFLAGSHKKSAIDKHMNKFDAFLAGKKVYTTIANPNDKETAKRFIRVEMSTLYGDYRSY